MTMALTDRQKEALKQLAHAYALLSNVWDDEFDNGLGVELDELGVLPRRDLSEAYGELIHFNGGITNEVCSY
jgi:hypothetical protein